MLDAAVREARSVAPEVDVSGTAVLVEPVPVLLDAAEGADLMLCVGSSLEVYPVAGLPNIALSSGAKLAIVTQGPTPYDAEADVMLDGDVVEELRAVLAAL